MPNLLSPLPSASRTVRAAVLGAALLVTGFTAEHLAGLRLEAAPVEAVPVATEPVDVSAALAGLPPAVPVVAVGARRVMGPVAGPVSSPFGWRQHPVSGRERHHDGVDLAVPVGTAVWAVAPGRVRSVGRRPGYGLVVEIAHASGLGGQPVRTRYAHLSAVDAAVRPGAVVNLGQALGASGGTPGRDGVSTGPHLHFEVQSAAGEPLDPARFVRLSGGAAGARRLVAARYVSGPTDRLPSRVPDAPPAPRDTVDIWPAPAPGPAPDDRLPDLVLPDYPSLPTAAPHSSRLGDSAAPAVRATLPPAPTASTLDPR